MRIGPYRLGERLGAGGMGAVYRAYDERLDRWVAIKVLHPDRGENAKHRERFRREARACARLDHPGIVRVFDLVREGKTEALVMELVEGRTLAELLRTGPLAAAPALSIAREVAEALAAAHEQGILHRDLKTENVLVTPAGQARIVDFGIAKQPDGLGEPLTTEGEVLGTPRAMSPEQARGRETDFRSDLFAFGVLLYEVFTGVSPFRAPTALATLEQVLTHLQPPASSRAPLSRQLSDLIDDLLEKDPERRPASARAVAAALARLGPSGPPEGDEDDGGLTLVDGGLPAHGAPGAGSRRRQVTVVRFGLVQAMGKDLAPAALLDAMAQLDEPVAAVVRRFDGHCERDDAAGWQALFGAPRAHEDDARRAVAAGLEVAARIQAAGLQAKIGAHTGPVLLAGSLEPSATGGAADETLARAAGLRSLAAPGTVLISRETCRLVRGFFDLEELPPGLLPGASGPLPVYRVRGGSGAHNRVQAAGSLTPLVGREQELGLLLERWILACEGRGQVVLLSGEAGLGKSRLLWELRQRLGADAVRLEGHASSFHRDSAFHPVLQWLDPWIGAERDDAAEIRLARLERTLLEHGFSLAETLPVLGSLLGLRDGRWPPVGPGTLRQRALETLLQVILAAAERQPLFLVLEDLHWADPSSLELLGRVIEQAGALRLLLVITFRPEARIPWGETSPVTRLTLGPLSRQQTARMIATLIETLAAGRAEDGSLAEQIAVRTDGVPLFVEELTRLLLETGEASGDRGPRDIPGSLEGWLGARLDRLDAGRQVAQLAAVLGRESAEELLFAVSPWDAGTLRRELDRLVAAEILFRQGVPPRVRYRFKHALIQDAAYAFLPEAERQRLHRRAAAALRERFVETAESQPELLAHHLTEAGQTAEAVLAWQRAGNRALRTSAYAEARAQLERALDLLPRLPETAERDRLELDLRLAQGTAKGHLLSSASPEVRDAYFRARELAERTGQHEPKLRALEGVYMHAMVSGRMRAALEASEEMLALARRCGSSRFLLKAHQAVGFSLLWIGSFVEAREHIEAALAFPPEDSVDEIPLPGTGHPRLEARCNLGTALWFLGDPDAALGTLEEALAEARDLSPKVLYCVLLSFTTCVHLWRGETERARDRAEEMGQIADREELRYVQAVSRFLRGRIACDSGEPEGLEQMRQTVAGLLAMGARAKLPILLSFLAESLLRAGRLDACTEAIEQGFAVSREGDHGCMDAELWRLRGELLLARQAPEGEAEAAFRQALDLARRQGARSLELRAATSLAHL